MCIKKIFKIQLVCFISLIIFISCKQKGNSDIIIDKFPKIITLSGELVKGIELFKPHRLIIVDSLLLINNYKEKFFRVYSTNTHKLLSEFGLRGRGPGEFISPELTGQVSFDKQTKIPFIYVYDMERHILSYIDVYEYIAPQGHSYKEERIPNVNSYLTRFFFKNNSFFFGIPESGGRFLFYNYKTSKVNIIPFIPNLGFNIKPSYLPNIYRSSCIINEESNILVSAAILLGEIDFFDLNGNFIKSTVFESDAKKNLKKDFSNKIEPKTYILQLLSQGNLIYGLNYNSNNWGVDDEKCYSKIEVFDWTGQPVKEYILDRKVFSFALDTMHKRIYGLSHEEEYPIVIYELEE